MKRTALIALTVVVFMLVEMTLAAAPQRRFSQQRIRFARGTHSETVRGKVSRDAAMLYIVGAKAGQSMTVTLDGDAKTRFDLSGHKDTSGQAISSGETEWSGTLPDDGDYKIFVFTEGNATAPFTLTVGIK